LISDPSSRHKDYLEALPEGKPKGTIVLIHGFPDISLGWRYQIPHFVKLGYQTIALDCMGYGKTVRHPIHTTALPRRQRQRS
jgi:alpha-beta hydrolase superfamily lysophospholipase